MYSEFDFIQLSALQHYMFCPRQCGLIHVEGLWSENVLTVRGELFHEKSDSAGYETRGSVKSVRGLRIQSRRLGLSGKCDVVEFHTRNGQTTSVVPVEFKVGKPKEDLSDSIQLCAQTLCLEEMLGITIDTGAFFYGRIRRRQSIAMDVALRDITEKTVASVHAIVANRSVPSAHYTTKCRSCSLLDQCQPKALNLTKLTNYMNDLYL